MALRRQDRPNRYEHRRGSSKRHAVVARQAYSRPDLETRCVRPHAVGPAEQGCGFGPVGIDERPDAADADPARTGAHVGHRRAMIMLRRASIATLPLVLAACDYQQYQSTFGNAAVEARQFNMLF